MATHHNVDFFAVAQGKIAAALRRARGGPIREADLVRIAQFLIENINAKVSQRAAQGELRDAAIAAELQKVATLAGAVGIMSRVRDAVLMPPHQPALAPEPAMAPTLDPAVSAQHYAKGKDPVVSAERRRLYSEFKVKYKAQAKERGVRINQEYVARAASPRWTTRSEIGRWITADPRSTQAADRQIRKVLTNPPNWK
jgi:hypothetical protein